MSSVSIFALYAVWLAMQMTFTRGCGYGSIGNTTATNCLLTCYDDYYVTGLTTSDLDTLSFDELKALFQICPSIQTAINDYGSTSCSSLSDLVWPSQCGCPLCRCQQADTITDYHEHQYPLRKECTTCTCAVINANGDQGWSCESDATYPRSRSIANTEEWNHFTCGEGITCSPLNTNDASIYQPGDVWWEDSTYDSSCQTFCYCQHDGTTYCETSYADIVTSSHPGLRTAYFDEDHCAATKGCANEPSLLVKVSSQCGCPKCMCPSGKGSGDKEYLEYTEPDALSEISNFVSPIRDYDDGRTHCMECTCLGSSGTYYRNCESDPIASYISGTNTCPPPVSATCLSGKGKNTSTAPLVSTSCYGDDTYCGWSFWRMIDTQGTQEILVSSEENEWGCQSRIFCEAFQISDGACFEIDVDYNTFAMNHGYTGCGNDPHVAMYDGLYRGVNWHEYHMCCSGTNCNDQNVIQDTSSCPSHTEINTWYSSYSECLYGDTSPYQTWMCDTGDTFTCQDLQSIGNWWFGCDCTAFSYLYSRVGTDGQTSFTQQMSGKLTQLDEWSTLLGCDLTFTCDLSTGEISVNGVVQTNSNTPAPTLSTLSPTESTSNPSQLPTRVTKTPTLNTSSPTDNPSQTPTEVTGAPITADPTIGTDAPTSIPSRSPTQGT
eukprot:172948_1